MNRQIDWQPIETAPRDGTVIDLWHRNGFRITDQWWDQSDGCWVCVFDDSAFTHWKPITEPGRGSSLRPYDRVRFRFAFEIKEGTALEVDEAMGMVRVAFWPWPIFGEWIETHGYSQVHAIGRSWIGRLIDRLSRATKEPA